MLLPASRKGAERERVMSIEKEQHKPPCAKEPPSCATRADHVDQGSAHQACAQATRTDAAPIASCTDGAGTTDTTAKEIREAHERSA